MLFFFVLVGILSRKEHPNTVLAAVHKEPGADEWRLPFLFQLVRKTSGEVLVIATKVWWSNLRARATFVHGFFLWTKQSMNSMILAVRVVGVYSLSSNLSQITVETFLSIITVAHRTYYTFSFYIFQHNQYRDQDSQEVIIIITRVLSNQYIDPCNTKLISSCLKQTLTPTLGPVTPTRTKIPEEVDRAKEALAAKAAAIAEVITKTA